MGPKLYRVPIFFGSGTPSSPELLTIWQWARSNSLWLGSAVEEKLHFWIGPQLFTVTSAGCKVLDHLHLCRVCLQLYIPPSAVTKHSMQLPSTYEPLHCAAPVPVYACLSLCVDIVFWFSFCIFFIHTMCLYIYISLSTYVFECIWYTPISEYYIV